MPEPRENEPIRHPENVRTPKGRRSMRDINASESERICCCDDDAPVQLDGGGRRNQGTHPQRQEHDVSVERTFRCDGPNCERHLVTTLPEPAVFLTVKRDVDPDSHFCGWDCVLRYAGQIQPEEIVQ